MKWLISQGGRCSVESLLGALCYETQVCAEDFDPEGATYADLEFDLAAPTILTACQNLVECIDEVGSEYDSHEIEYGHESDEEVPNTRHQMCFRFVHLSVQEYLEKHKWAHSETHAFAAKLCLHRLLDWQHHSQYPDFSSLAAAK